MAASNVARKMALHVSWERRFRLAIAKNVRNSQVKTVLILKERFVVFLLATIWLFQRSPGLAFLRIWVNTT